MGAPAAEELRSSGCVLKLSIEGRIGIVSSGVYRNRGESGNLPSGEACIAPVEGTAEGTVLVDGSFAGIGVLKAPLKLTFEKGTMTKAEGADAERLEAMLGDNLKARNLAELGIAAGPPVLPASSQEKRREQKEAAHLNDAAASYLSQSG